MRQLTLFDDSTPNLSGVIPAVRAAMNRAAGESAEGRKLLVDRINAIARSHNLRLTRGNARVISKDLLDKWLAPHDRDHTPSLLAVVVFCHATGDFGPLEAILRTLGLGILTPEVLRDAHFGRAVKEEKLARKRRRQLEETL